MTAASTPPTLAERLSWAPCRLLAKRRRLCTPPCALCLPVWCWLSLRIWPRTQLQEHTRLHLPSRVAGASNGRCSSSHVPFPIPHPALRLSALQLRRASSCYACRAPQQVHRRLVQDDVNFEKVGMSLSLQPRAPLRCCAAGAWHSLRLALQAAPNPVAVLVGLAASWGQVRCACRFAALFWPVSAGAAGVV